MHTKAIIDLEKVSYTWPGSRHFCLSIANFSLAQGERMLLLGRSGSGKSTLLSLLCGIVAPQEGSIKLVGQELSKLSAAQRDRLRGEHIGVIFQQFNLLPYATVAENILLPLHFAPGRRQRVLAKGDLLSAAKDLCQALQLPVEVFATQVAELSVGQQQRVAVARALIGEPQVIIADEPTSALDQQSRQAFMHLLMEQVAAAGSSLLMVSHDASLAGYFDRVVHLEELQGAGQC